MRLISLRDYLSLFIKRKYISSNTKTIKLLLNKAHYEDIKIKVVDENKFSVESNILNLLDLPVLEIRSLPAEGDNTVEIQINEVRVESKSVHAKTKIIIAPNRKELREDVVLYFRCMYLDKKYTDSFLYQKDYLNSSLYNSLLDHGSTVISSRHYHNITEYIADNLLNIYDKYAKCYKSKKYTKPTTFNEAMAILTDITSKNMVCENLSMSVPDKLLAMCIETILGLDKNKVYIKHVNEKTFSYNVIKIYD